MFNVDIDININIDIKINYYAAFKAPCIGQWKDESQAQTLTLISY